MMQLIKAILGGIVGGAIGTAVYYYLNPATPAALPWVAIATGLLTGIGVRICCGSGRSTLTGVVALAITLLMLLGWPVARDMQWLMSDNSELSKPLNVVKNSASVNPSDDKKSDNTDDGSDDDDDGSDGDASTSDDADPNDADPNDADPDDADPDDADPNDAEAVSKETARPPISKGVTAPEAPTSFFNFDPQQTNEAIPFGLAGLLAFLLGTGKGSHHRHSESAKNSQTETSENA